jgi:hypothetical protein
MIRMITTARIGLGAAGRMVITIIMIINGAGRRLTSGGVGPG